MTAHRILCFALAAAASLVAPACAYDTGETPAGVQPSHAGPSAAAPFAEGPFGATSVDPASVGQPSHELALPSDGPTVPGAEGDGEGHADEPIVSFEAAVITARDVRNLIRPIAEHAVSEHRTEDHDREEDVELDGLTGTVHSSAEGDLRVARVRVEGLLHGRLVAIDVAWTEWEGGELFDGTVTHDDMTIDLYDIRQDDPDGTIRWRLEDAWTVAGTEHRLSGGSVVIAPSVTDDPAERSVTAEGDLLCDGVLVGGLVARDLGAVIEAAELEVSYLEL